MQDSTYKTWDVIIKALGFIGTALSIYFGFTLFSKQQQAALELEARKNYWQKQIQVYSEVCNNAGAMVENTTTQADFEKEKKQFMEYYYGEIVLVEDSSVDKAMREIKSYAGITDVKDPEMVNNLKRRVLELAEACQRSVAFWNKTQQ